MRIYDSLSGEKKPLEKIISGKKIKLFVCGPTVYDAAHIGHARTYLAFDMLVRYLRGRGYDVFYLQGITNIDDKIIRRALDKKISALKLADDFTKQYLKDMRSLGITSVTKYAKSTDHIQEIVKQVQALVKKGVAYKIKDDGYYFDIMKFSDYGKLSHRTAAQAEDSVTRIDEGVNKRNKGDFCLWKFSKANEPSWKTPLGQGRPGWHIEDTAISEHFFGPQYDLHGGGLDLKFPHHEAEIAQQEAASGKKPFVKIWMHTGMLTVNGEKMSKSLNNFLTIADFLKAFSPNVLRLLVAQHQYRAPLNYSQEAAASAERALDSLNQFIAKLKLAKGKNALKTSIESHEALFQAKMEDDFNTPEALAVLFSSINANQKSLWSVNKTDAKMAVKWLTEKLKTFNLTLKEPKIPAKIKQLAKKRELFRTNKQFTPADDLRRKIEVLGYSIEDTPRGPFLWPKKLL